MITKILTEINFLGMRGFDRGSSIDSLGPYISALR